MIRLAAPLAILVLAGLGAAPLTAQAVRVELRAGAAVGNYTGTDAGLDVLPEPAYAAVLEVEPVEDLAAYVAFTRSGFGCEEGWCVDQDVSLTSQGLTLGGRWSPHWVWMRAGLAVQELDIEARDGSESSDTGLGFDLGAGIALDLGRGVELRPGVTYLRHEAATELGDGHVALLALHVGLAVEVARF